MSYHSASFASVELVKTHDEPRIADLHLAERLGFDRPRDIRKLIHRNVAELETYGVCAAVAQTIGPKGGRPSKAYLLNEGQALLVCIFARTPNAATVRREVIQVFQAYRKGLLLGAPAEAYAALLPAERRALRDIVRHAHVFAEPVDAFDRARPEYVLNEHGERLVLQAPVTNAIVETLSIFEADTELLEDEPDAEPSLGWMTTERGTSGPGRNDDREAEDEHDEDGGDLEEDRSDYEPDSDDEDGHDREDDKADCEPWLGWTLTGQHGNDWDLEEEHDGQEPESLRDQAWRLSRRDHRATAPKPQRSGGIDFAAIETSYALIGCGDCMLPLMPDQAKIVVEPLRPALPGDLVVVHLAPERARDFGFDSIVKRLVVDLRNPKSDVRGPGGSLGVLVEMINPRRHFFIDIDHIVAMHRIDEILPADAHETSAGVPLVKV